MTEKQSEKRPKPKIEEDRQLSRDLEATFPASDPPAAIQPGSGETGPEVAHSPPSGGEKGPKHPGESHKRSG